MASVAALEQTSVGWMVNPGGYRDTVAGGSAPKRRRGHGLNGPTDTSPCALRFADSPAREIGAGFLIYEAPMLILLALILAASLIAMQAAGLWVDRG